MSLAMFLSQMERIQRGRGLLQSSGVGSKSVWFVSACPFRGAMGPNSERRHNCVGGKWRLFSYVADISISDKIMPLNIEDLLQAPLVQCINSLHISVVEFQCSDP